MNPQEHSFKSPGAGAKVITHKPAFWAITIAVVFFVVNLTQIGRYGLSWDEPNGMERGRETVALVVGTILPATGDQNDYSPDDDLHIHPSFYATCDYGVSQALTNWFGCKPIPAGHFLNLLTASTGLVALFYLGTLLFNPTVGLVAEIFMMLFPRFIAHAHINQKDLPMMVFATVALLLLNVAAQREKVRYWILAGLGVAVAVTTKLDGLFVLPIFLVPWLGKMWSDNWRANLRNTGWFLGATAVFIYMLWPELWTNPLHLLQSVGSFTGGWGSEPTVKMPYLGHDYAVDQLPWHYDTVQFIVATPLILLLAAGAGMAWSLSRLFHWQDSFKHGLLWCWILFPVLPRMLPGIIKYDGMRHIFLIVPAVGIMAGLGITQLLALWRDRTGYKLAPVAACAAIVWSGWQILECHPYEGFYLNEATRAVVPAPNLGRYFDFNGWGTIYTPGVQWVNAHAPFQASIATQQYAYFLQYEGLRDDLEISQDKAESDYLLGCWNGKAPAGFHNPPAFYLRCYGANILCVYAKNSGKSSAPPPGPQSMK